MKLYLVVDKYKGGNEVLAVYEDELYAINLSEWLSDSVVEEREVSEEEYKAGFKITAMDAIDKVELAEKMIKEGRDGYDEEC